MPIGELVHGGVFADWFLPLATSVALESFRVIRVRRAGYGPLAPMEPISLRDHARHLAVLLTSLHLEKVHLAGHSSGALISLQFASEYLAVVQSLALIEPAPLGPFQVPAFAELGQRFIGPAMAAFAAADVPTAMEHFLRGMVGSTTVRFSTDGWAHTRSKGCEGRPAPFLATRCQLAHSGSLDPKTQAACSSPF